MLKMAATGRPVPNPTKSYWQYPLHPLANWRSTPSLPRKSDYVIIGSGITGASIAWKLLNEKPGASVTLIEARTICSAATGRNGGHCRSGRWLSFRNDLTERGEDEALRLEALEEGTVRDVVSLVQELEIDCDLCRLETADVSYTEEDWTAAKACLRARKDIGFNRSADIMLTERKVWEADEACRRLKVKNAYGAIAYPAYTLSPYKFVCGLLSHCLLRGLNIQTNTAVLNVQPGNYDTVWRCSTERGLILTPNLILATNAYTSALVPDLTSFIIPTRLQIASIRPGTKVPSSSPILSRSVSMNGIEPDYYYMTRPQSSSNNTPLIICGGGRSLSDTHEQPITDDSIINPTISKYLKSAAKDIFFGEETWGDNQAPVMEWTGIAGYTVDKLPVVGGAPQWKGLWVCAGFNGHGKFLAPKLRRLVCSVKTNFIP